MSLKVSGKQPLGDESGLASVDLVLGLIEFLADSSQSHGLSDIARVMKISKARAHRHLRALVQHGYVIQDGDSDRYQIGIRLLALGEAVRDRFDVLSAARPEMRRLRDDTGQTVTVSTLVDDAVVVLELLQGKTLIEFGIRPGSILDLFASAHGLVCLAFGPKRLLQQALGRPHQAWTPAAFTDPAALMLEMEITRGRGWATAPDRLMLGFNALGAPIFDHRDAWRGTIAIVGSTQFIPAMPSPQQIAGVTGAAAAASARLGCRMRSAAARFTN